MNVDNYEFIYREKFGFFFVKEEYVTYLKNIDKNVCKNYSEKRAYIGIVIQVQWP